MKHEKPREGPTGKAVGVYLPAVLYDSVLRIASEERRTASNLMRLFIEQGVAAREDGKKKERK